MSLGARPFGLTYGNTTVEASPGGRAEDCKRVTVKRAAASGEVEASSAPLAALRKDGGPRVRTLVASKAGPSSGASVSG